MGVHDRLLRTVFPSQTLRPTFILGTTTMGVFQTAPFEVTLAGKGETSFAIVPSETRDPTVYPPSTTDALRYLSNLSEGQPTSSTSIVDYSTLHPILLKKLCLNAIINPLTAIHYIPNGSLLLPPYTALLDPLIQEISLVFQKSFPKWQQLFLPGTLKRDTIGLCERTRKNRSSMLQDLDQGRQTEISFINGYVCELGRSVGVETPWNERMVREVLEKSMK